MIWDELMEELKKKLTKKEFTTLQEMINDYGSIEDFLVTIIRKSINPDTLSVNDIELCMQKALKIGAYVMATGHESNTRNNFSPEQIAREVAMEAYGESPDNQQRQNPLQNMMRQMADAISQAIMSEVMNRIKNIIPIQIQQNDNKNTDKKDNYFTGDE